MTRRWMILAAAVLAVFATPVRAEPLRVVASLSILADMTREIGGDAVRVAALVPPDGDAHVFEPSPADAKALAAADLIVLNGLGLEPWAERLIAAAGAKAPVVIATAGLTPLMLAADDHRGHGHAHDHHHGKPSAAAIPDPHAWQDVANGRHYAERIAAALAEARPEAATAFRERAQAYDRRLAVLDGWARTTLDAIPAARRKVISSHESFGYFARAYGVTVLAPVGLSTEAEPTPKAVAALIRQMKAEKVRAVFLENMTDPRLIRQVAKDAGGVVGGTLYADSLSAADGPAPTYEAMIRHNVTTIAAALGGP